MRLSGLRRTWLGVTTPGESRAPRDRIRNVVVEGAVLHFQIRRRFFWSRSIEFRTHSPETARALAQQLPDARSAKFEKRWNESREFHARLNALGVSAWVSPALVLANVLAFAALCIASKTLQPNLSQLISWGANFGPLTSGTDQWWRLLSAIFLHGDPVHLLLNMLVLWNVGRQTEKLYGSTAFALIYFAAGVCGNLARIVWDPSLASVGASGAIFGVLGAFLAHLLNRKSKIPRSIALAHWLSALLFVLFNLVGGFMNPFIDNAAHVGGLVSGFVLGWALVRPVDIEQRRKVPVRQIVSGAVVLMVFVGASLWQALSQAHHVSTPERYFLARPWYTSGEVESLQLWATVYMRASAGNISRAEFTEVFEKQILPFWKTADERMTRETPQVPAEAREMNAQVIEFVRLRKEWAQAIVTAASNEGDADAAAETVRLAHETQVLGAKLNRYTTRASMDQRPRALANSAFVSRLRRAFSRSSTECVEAPDVAGERLLHTDSPNDGPKMRFKAGCLAQRYFVVGDFEALENLIANSARNLADMRDGGSTLNGVLSGIDDYIDYGGNEIPFLMGKTSDWRRAVKSHLGADLVEVMLLRNWAWWARGGGYAKTVSPQAWEMFAIRTEMASVGLKEIENQAGANPYWYQLALNIGLDQSIGKEKMREIFEAGAAKFPDYTAIYTAMLRSLMPRWGGSLEEVDEFIVSAADSKRGTLHPDERYAQLYAAYAAYEEDEINIFSEGNASWHRIEDGFDRLRVRYPLSDLVVNQYAKLACTVGDGEAYQSLRTMAVQHPSSIAWSKTRSIESCDLLFKNGNGSQSISPAPIQP